MPSTENIEIPSCEGISVLLNAFSEGERLLFLQKLPNENRKYYRMKTENLTDYAIISPGRKSLM